MNGSLERIRTAYSRLHRDELVLFLKIRNLPITGSDADLVSRLTRHDSHTYNLPKTCDMVSSHVPPAVGIPEPVARQRSFCNDPTLPDLPVEILADIMDHVGDCESSRILNKVSVA